MRSSGTAAQTTTCHKTGPVPSTGLGSELACSALDLRIASGGRGNGPSGANPRWRQRPPRTHDPRSRDSKLPHQRIRAAGEAPRHPRQGATATGRKLRLWGCASCTPCCKLLRTRFLQFPHRVLRTAPPQSVTGLSSSGTREERAQHRCVAVVFLQYTRPSAATVADPGIRVL